MVNNLECFRGITCMHVCMYVCVCVCMYVHLVHQLSKAYTHLTRVSVLIELIKLNLKAAASKQFSRVSE